MKNLTFGQISFYAIWYSGIATLSLLGIWLLYQTLMLLKTVLQFFCAHINPVFGITCVCVMLFLIMFGDFAETRR